MGFRRRNWWFADWPLSAVLAVCIAIGLVGCGTAGRGRLTSPPALVPAVKFPDTGDNIHLGLAFDYSAHNAGAVSRNVDYIFGGYFVNWKFGIDPAVGHDDSYLPFDVDGYPQSYPGHSLSAWQAKHPDWIVYRCDRKTPAYYGFGNTSVPLDFSNPAVRAYHFREAATLFGAGASGVAFDDFTFANVEDRCGVYRNGVWTPLGYPGRWQDNAKVNNDMMRWLRDIRRELKRKFPRKTFGVNMNFIVSGLDRVREVTPYVDMFFDEAGFTAYGHQNLSGVNWQREVDGLEYLNSQGKAVDINGIVSAASDASVTPDQLNWVLSNYLLVKGPHSYTYVYAGNHGGYVGSPSGYGTFYDRPQYHIPIGHPTSNRFSSYGVQMRYYSAGLVIVNPSSWQTFAVPLGGDYRDMFGHHYTAVTVPPTSGIVLLNTG